MLYLVSCIKQDKKQYLGETGKTGEQRFIGHLNTVMNNNDTTAPVGIHFRSEAHSNANMVCIPFERITSRDPHLRRARERDKINRWQLIEHGLNRNL